MRRPLVAVLLAGALLVGAAAPALADPYTSVQQVSSALGADRVYVADDAEQAGMVDHDAIKAQAGTQIAVAVLPARAGDAQTIASALTAGRTGSKVALVLTGTGDYGVAETADGPFAPGQLAQLVAGVTPAAGNPEATLLSQLADIRATGRTLSSGSGSSSSSGGSSAGVVLLVIVVAIFGVGGFFVVRSSRRRRRLTAAQVAAERASVESLYQRLGSDVQTLSPGDDPVAQQAMADASERFTATGALLARADIDTVGELGVAKRTAVEGISAARVARQRLGLDPGPDPLPPVPSTAPQVQGAQTVQVGGDAYTGYGAYQPGASHYFGGGYYQGGYVPGGWYGTPFWETALISSIAFGGLGWGGGYGGGFGGGGFGGGGFGGGGYDQGYGSGYDQGYDAGQQQGGGWGGGDSGGGGGWDTGSGGGDSGGWGGGGDSGGGGGDGGGGW